MSPKAEEEPAVVSEEPLPVVDAMPVKENQHDDCTEVTAEDPVEIQLADTAYCFDFGSLCCGIGNKGTCPHCHQAVTYSDDAVPVGIEETKYYHSACYEEEQEQKQRDLENEKAMAIQALARGKLARAQLEAQKKEAEKEAAEEASLKEIAKVAAEAVVSEVETRSKKELAKAAAEAAAAEVETRSKAAAEMEAKFQASEAESKAQEDAKAEEEPKAQEELKAEGEPKPAEGSVEDDVDLAEPSLSIEAEADEDGSVEVKEVLQTVAESSKEEMGVSEDKSDEELNITSEESVESEPTVEKLPADLPESIEAPAPKFVPTQPLRAVKPQKKTFIGKLRKAFGCKSADTHVVSK